MVGGLVWLKLVYSGILLHTLSSLRTPALLLYFANLHFRLYLFMVSHFPFSHLVLEVHPALWSQMNATLQLLVAKLVLGKPKGDFKFLIIGSQHQLSLQ